MDANVAARSRPDNFLRNDRGIPESICCSCGMIPGVREFPLLAALRGQSGPRPRPTVRPGCARRSCPGCAGQGAAGFDDGRPLQAVYASGRSSRTAPVGSAEPHIGTMSVPKTARPARRARASPGFGQALDIPNDHVWFADVALHHSCGEQWHGPGQMSAHLRASALLPGTGLRCSRRD